VPMADVIGNETPWQRVSVPENKQQESVALGELVAQYEHKLGRLSMNPQLSGSLAAPLTQFAVSESFGKAQSVKSARIWFMAFTPTFPQRSGEDAIISSLVANEA
jgi:hypothetical protein